MTEVYLTRASREKLIRDLESLRERKRTLSREIAEAAEKGDLSENAEYHSAKEKMTEVLRRIDETESKLSRGKLIEEVRGAGDTVSIGVKVTLKDAETGDEFTYSLVGAEDSDPAEGKISVYSPLAQGLLGKKQGDDAQVALPAGMRVFKIVKTEPAD